MDNATFDRLARLLAGGASRRHTLRALIAAALIGGTADELLAAKKDKNNTQKKDGDKDRNGRDRDHGPKRGGADGNSDRVSAQGKNNNNNKNNKDKNKKKRKRKKKPNTNGGNSGNTCAGTPLRPGQDFLGCDFSGDTLRGEDLNSSSFKDVDLSDADLCGANLESTSFAGSDLSDANLSFVNLDSSSHSKTSFAGADLTGATLRVATFSKVDFTGANLTGAILEGATFADVEWSGAIFCRTVQPDGSLDNRDCDICENICGVCKDCDDGQCAPPDCCPDPERPGGICVDTDTDPANCGGCDRACFTNLANACVDGRCVCGNEPECSGDDTCCRGRGSDPTSCVDTDTDPLHCGSCDAACLIPTNPCLAVECQNGDCVEVGAADGTPCELEGDPGVCCAAGSSVTCVVGTECCSNAQCGVGEACCEGQCIDAQDDPNNCGGCGDICEPSLIPCIVNQCINGGCLEVFAEDGEPCTEGSEQGICCFNVETSLCIVDVDDNFDHCGGCAGCDSEKADACLAGVCVCGSEPECGANQTCCNGQCVNTQNDEGNCGGCNQLCAAISDPCFRIECIAGQCETVPAVICDTGAGEACCDGECKDIQNDPGNCGGCSQLCASAVGPCVDGVQCIGGHCTTVMDPVGTACELLNQDTGICCAGASSVICVADAVCCDAAQCVGNPDGAACCANQCVDTSNDPNNCGACGEVCEASTNPCISNECIGGQCTPVAAAEGAQCANDDELGVCCLGGETITCEFGAVCCTDLQCLPGETCCSGECVDTSDDVVNCGSCGFACDPAKADACIESTCVCGAGDACGASDTCCAAQCLNTSTSFENCGACGAACLANADTCANGECVCGELGVACPEGNLCCGGACIDSDEDRQNCGICGETCATDETCESGACTTCAGAVCADTCIPGGTCCTVDQCAPQSCQTAIACNANQCAYQDLADDTPCTNGGLCVAGQCLCGAGPACESGTTCCDDQCIDTSSDRFNCGVCGHECIGGICSGGECVDCEGGIPCGSECLAAGPGVCCVAEDCTNQGLCRIPVGCTEEHICVYGDRADGFPCGCNDGQCQSGVCVGGEC